jgi:hypothetical protein
MCLVLCQKADSEKKYQLQTMQERQSTKDSPEYRQGQLRLSNSMSHGESKEQNQSAHLRKYQICPQTPDPMNHPLQAMRLHSSYPNALG